MNEIVRCLVQRAILVWAPKIPFYQSALWLTHDRDSQRAEILIRCCKRMEACDGSSDRGSA